MADIGVSAEESCCTCASILPARTTPQTPAYTYDFSDEKKQHRVCEQPSEPPRQVPCCSRLICATCQIRNPRFTTYCPFCQISSERSALPQGLRDPPAYNDDDSTTKTLAHKTNETQSSHEQGMIEEGDPPAYTPTSLTNNTTTSPPHQQPHTTHHLHPTDTLSSISLSYHVPIPVLRTHNRLHSDALLAARRTISIPASYYTGPSLSDQSVESEEERLWKIRVRRFMVRTKCVGYDVAGVYLRGAVGSVEKGRNPGANGSEDVDGREERRDEVLEAAVRKWEEDERWEREHPFEKGKRNGEQAHAKKTRGPGGSLVGQLR